MADPEFLEALRNGAREVLADHCSSAQLHHFIDNGRDYDASLWKIATDLGWMMVAVPERHGGLGGTVEEAAALQRELGRSLAPIPFLTTALVELSLGRWPEGGLAETLLPRLSAGELIAGIGQIGQKLSTLIARRDGEVFLIGGDCRGVLDGAAADLLLVEIVDADGGDGLVLLDRGKGVCIEPQPVADRTRSLVTLTCDDVEVAAERVLFGHDAALVASKLADDARILIANDAIGGAEAVFEKTVEYLKTRIQFGKPIGSFQALKHRCANHRVAIEAARMLVDRAQSGIQSSINRDIWAGLAKSSACDAYAAMGADAVQMHGGIGFTWEHDAHLYFKRAALDQFLCGNSAEQLDRVAHALLTREAA